MRHKYHTLIAISARLSPPYTGYETFVQIAQMVAAQEKKYNEDAITAAFDSNESRQYPRHTRGYVSSVRSKVRS